MKKIMIVLLCLFLQACVSCVTCPLQLAEGKRAFDRGDFKVAFNKLMPPAIAGNAQAEYAIGYMYYNGYGVPADSQSGLFWIHRAADQQFPPAIHALEIMH